MILTVGHSNRPLADFLAMLEGHGVRRLFDVRTIPKSRHNPHFAGEALARSLAEAGIAYTHLPGLGGFRKPRPDSGNGGFRNDSFRGYADYMQTPEFGEHLGALVAASESEQVAIMCAEAVPWRCHRSLVSDALLARGVDVREIVDAKRTKPHALTTFARVDGTRVTYPPEAPELPFGA